MKLRMGIFIIIFGICSGSVVHVSRTCAQEDPSLYRSLHLPREISYCSSFPCTEGAPHTSCNAKHWACSGENPYFKSERLTGYKHINNLRDSRILCGQEFSAGGCSSEPTAFLPNAAIGSPSNSPPPDSVKRFRVFVPPGTLYAALKIDCYINTPLAVAVRFDQPPQFENIKLIRSDTDYYAFPFERDEFFSLSEISRRDLYYQSAQAHVQFQLNNQPGENPDGGWLYVYAFYRPVEDSILKVNYTVKVNVDEYLAWYDRCETQGGCWNSDGDPLHVGDNKPPEVALTASQSIGIAPMDVTFSSTVIDDGTVSSYHWDFGDGNSLTTETPSAEHTYTSIGAYTAEVTATDDGGKTGRSTLPIKVVAQEVRLSLLKGTKEISEGEVFVDTDKLNIRISTKSSAFDNATKADLYLICMLSEGQFYFLSKDEDNAIVVKPGADFRNATPFMADLDLETAVHSELELPIYFFGLFGGKWQIFAFLKEAGTEFTEDALVSNLAISTEILAPSKLILVIPGSDGTSEDTAHAQ